jgi:general secretion pathway protein N
MRIETIGLRTWLLITFAGWALLACVLALAGLGQRVALLPDDALASPPLPALPAAAGERLGAADRYAEIGARPVFAQDRQPHPFYLTGGNGEAAANTSLRLTGVLITPQLQMATLTTEQGQSLRLRLQGEAVSGWRLLELAPRAATVEGPGGTRKLELHVFNGQGGQPGSAAPTAAVAAAAVAGNAPAVAVAPPVPAPSAPPPMGQPGSPQPESGTATPPAPSDAQLQAIRDRIEARRRQLRERQQTGAATGQ